MIPRSESDVGIVLNPRRKGYSDFSRSANGSIPGDFRSVNVGEFRVRIIRFLPHHEKVVSIRSDPGPILVQRVGGDGNSIRADHDTIAANQGAIDFRIAETRRRAAVVAPHDEIVPPIGSQTIAASCFIV